MPKLKNPSVQVTFRMKTSARKEMNTAAQESGRCEAAYIRDAINEKLHRDKTQESLINSIQSMQTSMCGLQSASRLNYAAITGLAKLMLVCLREPQGEVLQSAIAAAPDREKAVREFVLAEWMNADSDARLREGCE